ncbi:MAG: NAD-dependent epimerase/dehydratase family protein [Pirellula sp.]|jgi:UDP-2-acetamido-2,6-beta-L-arabino-hexul-4-ose reductase
MQQILITGANGFIGKNLDLALRRTGEFQLVHSLRSDSNDALRNKVRDADVVFHLAGANRPQDPSDFQKINVEVSRTIVDAIRECTTKPQRLIYSSSIQALADNPYGHSKRQAETLIESIAGIENKVVQIYRLPNVFGKWSRPEYNSAVATFCYNIARGLPITISAPERLMEMVYVDDVVRTWMEQLRGTPSSDIYCEVNPVLRCTLANLAERIQAIHDMRTSLHVPDLSDRLNHALHATYTSFLPENDLARSVQMRTDERGWLFELTKSPAFGQVFVSTTKPGVTRGNHYHDSKIERFCLVQGKGLIRFRKMDTGDVIEYPVSDSNIQLVDIPPGYTHSIENVGESDMLVLFWANEIFDPNVPDTYFEKVLH